MVLAEQQNEVFWKPWQMLQSNIPGDYWEQRLEPSLKLSKMASRPYYNEWYIINMFSSWAQLGKSLLYFKAIFGLLSWFLLKMTVRQMLGRPGPGSQGPRQPWPWLRRNSWFLTRLGGWIWKWFLWGDISATITQTLAFSFALEKSWMFYIGYNWI